ncbi:MAG: DUF4130 domain-containing protein [Candidatus Methanofastidiosia archaeon]
MPPHERSPPRLKNSKSKRLLKRIFYALRFKGKNNLSLIRRVLKQAEENGLEYVLSNISKEARELYRRYRAVQGEVHKAHGFLRFEVYGDVYITKARFEHRVEDMVLSLFMRKYPEKFVVLISKKAWVGFGGEIRVFESVDLRKSRAARDELWEAYYNSAYIEKRRNRKHAMHAVPKKFWRRFGMAEGLKIDKGIQKGTLEEWL